MTDGGPLAHLFLFFLILIAGVAVAAPFYLIGTHRRLVRTMRYGIEEAADIQPRRPDGARPKASAPVVDAVMVKADALAILGKTLLSSLKVRKVR